MLAGWLAGWLARETADLRTYHARRRPITTASGANSRTPTSHWLPSLIVLAELYARVFPLQMHMLVTIPLRM